MDPVKVAAGLVFRDGQLLITQRYPEAHLGGLWEFPGGKCHPAESFMACLERELAEELGIAVRVGHLVAAVTHHYPEKTVHIEFYRCCWTQNEPRPLGCHDLRWVAASDLKSYAFPEADQELVHRLLTDPSLWWQTSPPA